MGEGPRGHFGVMFVYPNHHVLLARPTSWIHNNPGVSAQFLSNFHLWLYPFGVLS